MTNTKLARVVSLVVCTLAFVVLAPLARATYGGSAGYQQEARENSSSCPYQNDCFGRCGKGCSSYFGTAVTPQCLAHDQCIKDNMCSGKSEQQSHINCLYLLGAGVWSAVQFHWNNYATYAQSPVVATWATVAP